MLGETDLEIPISSAKNRKKNRKSKKKKGMLSYAYLSTLLCVLGSYPPYLLRALRDLVPKMPKKSQTTVKAKKKMSCFAPCFSTSLCLLRIYSAKTYRCLLWANVKSKWATAGSGERQVYAGNGGAPNPKAECRTGHWKQK